MATTTADYPVLTQVGGPNGPWQPAKPLKRYGIAGLWERLRCKHDLWPEGFADWYCPKCGWES